MRGRIAVICGLCLATGALAREGVAVPPPVVDAAKGQGTAVFAGGCFWGVQGVFQHVAGVSNAVSGYVGGTEAEAHYLNVGTGTTGHAEAVEVTFDPDKISYGTLLQLFFAVAHDPTQLNRQGPDEGPQYRSAIFPRDEAQAAVARDYIAQIEAARVFAAPLATRIAPGAAFYPAESYHQDYLTLNPDAPYILVNDLPKVERLRAMFPALYREDPALVSEAGTN